MKKVDVEIRQETSEDYDRVYKVVEEAFLSAEYADGNEQDLVVNLRETDGFIPELSLVAIVNDKIVGHVMFTQVKINGNDVLALGPLSVLSSYQHKGIGAQLVDRGHEIAKKLNYKVSIVLGSEKYYPKFGYIEARKFGITCPFDVPSINFMVVELFKGALKNINGDVEYSLAFFE